ncbi:hypothetical protein [Sphingobium sp.]|nr:hypothetical protein [Sphingobium sp.]HUD91565.1 hypothetical protein [Sphingobium sp.]
MDQELNGYCRPLSIFEKCQVAIIGGIAIGLGIGFLLDFVS